MEISIIIPACNEEKYIENTLKNIPSKYETIVVCNGCTDKTEEVVKKFPVKIISTKQRGTSLAKNLGAKESKGNMLIFLDADIVINEKVIQAISKTKYDIGTIKLVPNIKKPKAYVYSFLKNLQSKYVSGGGVIFCKKELFETVNGFKEHLKFREDRALIREIKTIGKYGYISEPGIVNLRRLEQKGYLSPILTGIKSLINEEIDYPLIR